MTVSLLLSCICIAISMQVAAAAAIALWRRKADVAAQAATRNEELSPEFAGAWSGWREFRVLRRQFEDRARSQCSFYLGPVDGAPLARFEPGQYLTLQLPVLDASVREGRRLITRCYSLSDCPNPYHYRITVKRVAPPTDRPELPPGASSNHLHDHVRDGDVLRVKAPAGRFVMDAEADVPAVLLGAGVGITPLLSMLLWCFDAQPARTLHLYYGVRNAEELAFADQLDALARSRPLFHLNILHSRPCAADGVAREFHFAGHVDIDLLRRTLPHGRHAFFVCGPASMMDQLVPALLRWGVPAHDIHGESFGPARARPQEAAEAAPASRGSSSPRIQFRRSGRALPWDGQDENLLDFAERHGVVVESGCRCGACGSCETKVVSGQVLYRQDPDHDIAPGHCLLCVGAPGTSLVLEA